MRTSQPISAIRHLIPLALACAAILSTSAMCENDLLDPVAPGPVDPEPTPEVLYAPYTLIVSGGKSVYFDAAERPEAVFEVRCAQEPELAFEAEGCGYTYEKTFGYSESARMNAAAVRVTVEPRDTVWSLTLTASNAKGSSAKTCRGEKARLTYPARHYDVGLGSGKIDLKAKGNFTVMETTVDTIGTYRWRNIATGYEQSYINMENGVADIAFNKGIHWRTTEPRHMVFVVTAKAPDGRSLTDTVTVNQAGDDLSWAWDEINALCELEGKVWGYNNYQELLENEILPTEQSINLQYEEWDREYGEGGYKHYGFRYVWTPSDNKDGHVHSIYLVEETDEFFEIPESIKHLKYLDEFWITNKKGGITWPLPEGIMEMKNLKLLKLDLNNLSGRLESQTQLKEITEMNDNIMICIYDNNFYGPIPEWAATHCGMNGNRLEGELPEAWKDWMQKRILRGTATEHMIPLGVPQQDGYKVWLKEDEPEEYEYHDCYYWK